MGIIRTQDQAIIDKLKKLPYTNSNCTLIASHSTYYDDVSISGYDTNILCDGHCQSNNSAILRDYFTRIRMQLDALNTVKAKKEKHNIVCNLNLLYKDGVCGYCNKTKVRFGYTRVLGGYQCDVCHTYYGYYTEKALKRHQERKSCINMKKNKELKSDGFKLIYNESQIKILKKLNVPMKEIVKNVDIYVPSSVHELIKLYKSQKSFAKLTFEEFMTKALTVNKE